MPSGGQTSLRVSVHLLTGIEGPLFWALTDWAAQAVPTASPCLWVDAEEWDCGGGARLIIGNRQTVVPSGYTPAVRPAAGEGPGSSPASQHVLCLVFLIADTRVGAWWSD